MKQLKEWKARFIVWLLSRFGLGYFIILHGSDEEEEKGCTLWTEDDSEHLSAILRSTVENVPQVRELVFDAVIAHLKRFEVDSRNFLEKLNEN